jgi:hypothetical protein
MAGEGAKRNGGCGMSGEPKRTIIVDKRSTAADPLRTVEWAHSSSYAKPPVVFEARETVVGAPMAPF